MSVIDFQDVSFTYGDSDSYAIRRINLQVNEGEFILLSGSTGCGKTTLIRCINGLIPHFHQGKLEGKIFVNGLLTTEHSVAELAMNVGLVFQNPENQLVSLNVLRELAFGPENMMVPREEINRRIEDILTKIDLRGLLDKTPTEMSGGEQQQVAIASVLTLNPKIILLDEPTANLDPKSAKQIIELLGRLNREYRMTIILIEHRLDILMDYATRILLMENGEITADGDPASVLYSSEAEKCGVNIPKVIRVFKDLENRGYSFKPRPVNINQAVKALTEMS